MAIEAAGRPHGRHSDDHHWDGDGHASPRMAGRHACAWSVLPL